MGPSPSVKDVSSCPILRPVPQAFVLSFLPHAQAGLVHNLDFLVPHITPAFSLLACFSAALLRCPPWSPLSFLSQVAGMGSVESGLRRRSIPGRRCGDLQPFSCLHGIARHRFPTGLRLWGHA